MTAADTAPTRRRLDQVLEPSFVEGLDSLPMEELRGRRQLAHDVGNELSYYRRLLHGRMDLIRFEQRRRAGEESRSLIDALPEILSDPDASRAGRARGFVTDLPPLPEVGRREVDHVLGSDVLARLDELDDDELEVALSAIAELEEEISEQRRRVHQVEDDLAETLSERFRAESATEA